MLRRPHPTHVMYCPGLQDKDVQARLVAERKKAIQRDALARASRNSTKQAKTRKTAGRGGSSANPDFGGW